MSARSTGVKLATGMPESQDQDAIFLAILNFNGQPTS